MCSRATPKSVVAWCWMVVIRVTDTRTVHTHRTHDTAQELRRTQDTSVNPAAGATRFSGGWRYAMLSSLERGRELLEAGAITTVEFQALKQKLLKQARVQPAIAEAACV